uniref:Helicase ATP-binding domain-containing protein n=1 Tax=viral metagenome TaxID=1070528 RepID=A0A6C0EB51_9ZZZZ
MSTKLSNADYKLEKRINDMFDSSFYDDDFMKSIALKPEVEKKIIDYQILHVMNIVTSLNKHNIAIDSSSTGTGKTYTTIAVCKQLNLKPFIICPKSVIGQWKNVCKHFDVVPELIVNYETLKSKKQTVTKYLTIKDDEYKWSFRNNNIILIFDEVHKCKHIDSQNAKLLLSAKNKVKMLLLSATLCDKNDDFLLYGYILNLYSKFRSGKQWIQQKIREYEQMIGKKKGNALSKFLYPEYGSQMSIADISNYPLNKISAECYDLDTKILKKINNYYQELKDNNDKDCELGIKTKLRMKIEKYKLPIIYDLAMKYLEQNKSVVIFVNFVESLKKLEEKFADVKYSKLCGDQKQKQRDDAINKFQENKVRLMLSMIQVGGASISLHDVDGNFPRVSIISPSFSSIELIQTLGRVCRSGSSSPCLQRIVFCSDTYEEQICKVINDKINFINNLTDDDLEVKRI